MSFG
jgi:hypothetical protein